MFEKLDDDNNGSVTAADGCRASQWSSSTMDGEADQAHGKRVLGRKIAKATRRQLAMAR